MPRPVKSQLRPIGNPLLTSMLVSYQNNDADFIARLCAPVLAVNEESGTYATMASKHTFKDSMKRRAYGAAYPKGGLEFGSDTYATQQWALSTPIPDEHEATSQLPVRLQQIALNWLAGQSSLRKERAFAADFFTTSVWDNDVTPTDWDDASGVPITDCGTARRTIKQGSGHAANAIAMGEIVFDALKVNAQILDHLKYTKTMTVAEAEALMAITLGFEHLYVGKAVYNTANTGQAASLSPIIDDDALVFRVMPGPDMFDASAMKTLTWAPGGGEGSANSYYSDDHDATMVKSKEQWDQKLIGSSLGYFFDDIV